MASLGKSHELSRPNSASTNLEKEGPPSAHRGYLRHFRLPLSLPPSLLPPPLLLSFPAFKRGNISLQRRRISLTTSARSLGSLLCSADNRQGGRDGRGGVPSIPSARAGRTDIRRRPRLERASALCAARDRGAGKNGMVWHERASWEREKFKAASWDQRPLHVPASLSSLPLSLSWRKSAESVCKWRI